MLPRRYLRMLAPIAMLVTAAACDTTESLQTLRSAPQAESPYHRTLAVLYQAYSETEMAAYDWWTSKYFADKGLMVAYGGDVAPEDPTQWQVRPEVLSDLITAREQLLLVLNEATIAAHPEHAATAIAAYDCWVEQEDDGWKADRIAICRGEFEKSMHAITAPALPIEPPTKPVGQAPEITKSVLYFPFDTEALEKTGLAILDKLIHYVTNAGDVEVVINGHADRVGSDQYNMKLSEQRAKYVQSRLLEAGIAQPRISYFAFGESDPEIPTEDGVAEPANRRVEIFLE